ncbi:YihY family inner membrane protein [Streptomyces sp. HPH0547]|nr:YihY family inner membrane protein [Streptomyces sp. HPH0547]
MRAVDETPEQTGERAPWWAPRRSRGQFRRARVKYRDVPKRRMAWLLLKDTVNSCMEYRVLGLAAEAAFFTLISIPPLLLGLIGSLGYLDWIGADTVDTLRRNALDASATVLSDKGVDQLARPLIDDVIRGGGPDVISLGFALALWSGSRAVNVFIDTITVMYGLDGRRGIVKTRLLAFFLYLIALVIGAVALPLMVAGPDAALRLVPQAEWVVSAFYWPVVLLLSVVFLTTLYHVSVPVRSPWREDVPGALVALVMWVVCSFLLRLYLTNTVEGPTIYGSLAAPVAVLLWIGVSAFAVLVGAAVNAAIDHVWPSVATAAARRANERLREEAAKQVVAAAARRRRGAGEEADEDGDLPDAPAEFPERWTKFLPPSDVRGRLLRPRGRDRHETDRDEAGSGGADHGETGRNGTGAGIGDQRTGAHEAGPGHVADRPDGSAATADTRRRP